ncbi:MAG: hypothetical protein ACREIC_26035 [Limisphaerales bacterium]
MVKGFKEQLDYEPGRSLKRRAVRHTYMHRTEPDSVPVSYPLPSCLKERGLAVPDLLAYVLVSKICDHLTLIVRCKFMRNWPTPVIGWVI